MQIIVETPIFTRRLNDIFDEDEKAELINHLADNPLAGVVIPGTNGVRKMRFASSGRGKRGGVRVIYYFLDDTMPPYALLVYPKNVRDDMSPDEKRAISDGHEISSVDVVISITAK